MPIKGCMIIKRPRTVFWILLFLLCMFSVFAQSVVSPEDNKALENIDNKLTQLITRLGYPEDTFPALIREFNQLFSEIDFVQLHKEIAPIRDAAKIEELESFLTRLVQLVITEGDAHAKERSRLLKLLVTSLIQEDIFEIINQSTVSQELKADLSKQLLSCTAKSQLAYILLSLLDFDVRGADAPEHAFTLIPLSNIQVLLVDLSCGVVRKINLANSYQEEGKYLFLKPEHRIPSERLLELQRQREQGVLVIDDVDMLSENELLHLMYFYIQWRTDGYGVTSSIYSNFGAIYGRLGNPKQAIKNYKKALEINPNDAGAYSNLGAVYAELGMFDQAIKELKEALEINPNHAGAHSNLGSCYVALRMYDQAIEELKKSIDINPSNAEAYSNLGAAYVQSGMYDQAIKELKKAIDVNPSDAEGYSNLGAAYVQSGMYDQAIKEVKKALEINPKNPTAYCIIGAAYVELHMDEKAIKELEKALEINPTFTEARNNIALAYHHLGLSYYKSGNYEQAIIEYKKAIIANPNYATAYHNLGIALLELGVDKYSDAIEAFKNSIEINPKYAQAYYNLGFAYYKLGQIEAAFKSWVKAVKLNSELLRLIPEEMQPKVRQALLK